MEELKRFIGGGMNTEDAPNHIQSNDYISSFNALLSGSLEGENTIVTNLPSTREIVGYSLPAGINKCIGAEKFENERIILAFIYNSFGFHQFFEYNYDTDVKTLLFTNKTNSGGIDILPLTVSNYISDIKLANGTEVIFTDSNMEIGYINKERLKSGALGVVTQDDVRLIKAQPLRVPQVRYGDDAGRVVNLMKNKLFQYRYQYGYLDNEPSSYSSISKRQVPTKESTTAIGEDVTKNNHQVVSVDAGTNRVLDINIAARYDTLDWETIKSVKRAYVVALPNTAVDVTNEIYEAYNPTTNQYSFVHYNDGLYVNIDPRETDSVFDNVPRKAESLELLESNILAVAGLTEGYERPVIEVRLSAADYDPKLETAPLDPNQLRVTNMYDTDPPGKVHKRRIHVNFAGIAKTGDKISMLVRDFRNMTITKTYSYTVESIYNNNTLGALQKLASNMGNSGGPGGVGASVVTVPGGYQITWLDFEFYGYGYSDVENSSVGTGQLSSIHALKSNSAYQACIIPFDHYGRPLPVITSKDFIFKTNSYAQSKGLSPRLSWQLLSNFPKEVESFQWGLSLNTTHQNTLFINVSFIRVDGQYIVLNMNPLKTFNERNASSILNYEYSEGDRATFMYYESSGTKVYFDNPFIDVQVAGFDIVVDTTPDPDTTTYELKVKLNSSIDTTAIAGKNIYIELYTPKKRVVVNGDTTTYLENLFFEIGEQFDVIDGVPQVTSGTITDGDIYFQTRDYVSAVDDTTYTTYLAEDFNFSPLYKSNYTSYGRGFQYNERDGVKIRKAGIRYSDKYVIESKLNLLNRFYAERLYGDNDGESSSNFGWIRKIRQRDNYLICIQEVKEGHIPLFQSIVEDQSAQAQAFLSDKLFNKIRYSNTGSYGMGNAPESYSESPSGSVGFIDPNNSVPMRDGANGLTDISGKMSKFFKQTLQAAKQAGKSIIGYWDNYTLQRVFSIQEDEDTVVQVPVNENSLVYQDPYAVAASDITITQQPANSVISFTGGQWVITPNAGYVGSQTFKYSFTVNGTLIIKNECFTVIAGDVTPIPFLFQDLFDQELNTEVTSNVVGVDGINVPVNISITGGTYAKNGGTFGSAPGKVIQDDTVVVKLITAPTNDTTTNATLTIGSYSDTFSATTKSIPPDPNPDPYTFASVTDANLNVEYPSEVANITGINVPIPISVNTGQYAINGGPFTSAVGTVVNGDQIELQLISSNSYNTTKTMTVTTGSYSTTYSVTTEEAEIGNTYQSQSFQRNNCASGSSGTFYNYEVLADTYFAETLSEANSLALADIAANGQNEANLPENASCILNTVISTLVVDIDSNTSLISSFYIDTPGVTESGTVVASGQNFFPYGTPAESNYMLASDLIIGGETTKWRYEASIGKLINLYPDTTAYPNFIYKLRGHGTSAGTLSGTFALKFPNQKMIMLGDEGEYIPSVTPPGGPAVINWSGPLTTTPNTVIATFTYNRGLNTITVS